MSKQILWVSLLFVLLLNGCNTAVKLGERDAQKEERIAEIEQSEETARTSIDAWAEQSKAQNETIQAQAEALSSVAIAQIHANKETNLKGMDLAFAQWQEQQQAVRTSWWMSLLGWLGSALILFGAFLAWCLLATAKRSEEAQQAVDEAELIRKVSEEYKQQFAYMYGAYKVHYPKEVQRCLEEEV